MLLRSQRGKTYISSGLLLPSKVTHLVIKRPSHFHFHPGDYVFVNIPVIARFEWHPFTISSAPEQEGGLLICYNFISPLPFSHCNYIYMSDFYLKIFLNITRIKHDRI